MRVAMLVTRMKVATRVAKRRIMKVALLVAMRKIMRVFLTMTMMVVTMNNHTAQVGDHQ